MIEMSPQDYEKMSHALSTDSLAFQVAGQLQQLLKMVYDQQDVILKRLISLDLKAESNERKISEVLELLNPVGIRQIKRTQKLLQTIFEKQAVEEDLPSLPGTKYSFDEIANSLSEPPAAEIPEPAPIPHPPYLSAQLTPQERLDRIKARFANRHSGPPESTVPPGAAQPPEPGVSPAPKPDRFFCPADNQGFRFRSDMLRHFSRKHPGEEQELIRRAFEDPSPLNQKSHRGRKGTRYICTWLGPSETQPVFGFSRLLVKWRKTNPKPPIKELISCLRFNNAVPGHEHKKLFRYSVEGLLRGHILCNRPGHPIMVPLLLQQMQSEGYPTVTEPNLSTPYISRKKRHSL